MEVPIQKCGGVGPAGTRAADRRIDEQIVEVLFPHNTKDIVEEVSKRIAFPFHKLMCRKKRTQMKLFGCRSVRFPTRFRRSTPAREMGRLTEKHELGMQLIEHSRTIKRMNSFLPSAGVSKENLTSGAGVVFDLRHEDGSCRTDDLVPCLPSYLLFFERVCMSHWSRVIRASLSCFESTLGSDAQRSIFFLKKVVK